MLWNCMFRLPCSAVTYGLLGSYLAQSLLGDYDPSEHGIGCDYLRHIQFAPGPCQTDELLETIAELHQSRRGQSPTSAELEYLVNASRLAMYGVDLHPVLVICCCCCYCKKHSLSQAMWTEMLMQLWRPEFVLDGINLGSWYHCLPIRYITDSDRETVQQLCAK